MNRSNIVYFGGGWPTNIGNAFIDLGAMHSLRMANPNMTIQFASEMPTWFFYIKRKKQDTTFDLARFMNVQYVVVSGMALCDEFIKLHGPTISTLLKKKTKFIINGAGGAAYTKEEVKNFRNFLKENPPYAFISRDELAFEYYHDLAEHAHNGIDCAFFVSDCFTPAKLDLPEFVIFNFDTSRFRTFLRVVRERSFFQNSNTQIPEIKDTMVIRTHHSCWKGIPRAYTIEPNTFISDIPEDYLNLYANTQATYSDRVHACVATLAFGKPAMLFSQTPRGRIFQKVGAATIRESLTHPDRGRIEEEKTKQIAFLARVLQA